MRKLNKIVLIDDSVATNQLNHAMLEGMDIANQITSYTSGKAALSGIQEAISTNTLPEIILLDIQMPDMDGFEFLEKYVNLEEYKQLDLHPMIVIVSNYLNFENFSKSQYYKSFGVLDHIRKPIDQSDVTELIEEYFDKN